MVAPFGLILEPSLDLYPEVLTLAVSWNALNCPGPWLLSAKLYFRVTSDFSNFIPVLYKLLPTSI